MRSSSYHSSSSRGPSPVPPPPIGGGVGSFRRGSREDALKRMSKLVNFLLARGDCGPFREPVDWRGLELYDYPKIIKKMMDLGTVKRKLERGQYETAHECAEDVRLIWTNCKTYNADGSDFYLLAEGFSKKFEDRYRKIRAEYDTGEPEKGGPSANEEPNKKGSSLSSASSSPLQPPLEARAKFAANLFRLSGTELGHVLRTIDLRCPRALEPVGEARPPSRPPASNLSGLPPPPPPTEVEINVDALDNPTFLECDRYMRERVSSSLTSPFLPAPSRASSSSVGDDIRSVGGGRSGGGRRSPKGTGGRKRKQR